MGNAMTTSAGACVHAGRVSDPDPEVPERATRRRYPAKYKLEILAEYEALDRDGKGALLRREGLYTSLISAWRKQRDRGALEAFAPAGPPAGRPAWNARTPGCAAGRAARGRSGEGPQGDRGPGKTLRAAGGSRDRQRGAEQSGGETMIDQAITSSPRGRCQGGLRRGGPAPAEPLPPPPPAARRHRARAGAQPASLGR